MKRAAERRTWKRLATGACAAACVWLIADRSTSFACDSWKKVFEAEAEGVHFAGVLAGEGAEWAAGGIGIVAAGSGAQYTERALPGLTMERLAIGPDGNTYAVGSHGTIWRRSGKEDAWLVEHQSRPPGTKGKKPNEDLLVALRVLSHEGKPLLLAHGPVGKPLLVREPQGTWSAIAESALAKELVKLSLFGPPLELPRNCNVDSWRWINQRDGLALCRDGRAFVLAGGKVTSAGKAPKECQLMRNVVERKGELYTSCGDSGRISRYAGGKWSTVDGVTGVFALAANDQCLVAATKRAVWQQCW